MKLAIPNGWTGGQYSLFRFAFGVYLCIHFARLIPWGAELFSSSGMIPDASVSPLIRYFPNVLAMADVPGFVRGLLGGAAVLSMLFALGVRDRAVAIVLWYVWACLFGRNPLIANSGLAYVGWMLLAHAFLPRAPYGSWDGRGRIDPGSEWRLTPEIFAVAWIVMAVAYFYSGFTKLASPAWLDGTALAAALDHPLARPGPLRDLARGLPDVLLRLGTYGALALELLFAPLVLFKRARPILWGAMLAAHVSLIGLMDFADLSLSMVMLHFFTFDPAWIRPVRAEAPDRFFYDGHCGLCHRTVRFLLSEDRDGKAFVFSPLQSEVFAASVPESERGALPDSIVILTADGRMLTRSAAALYTLERLGGIWRLCAAAGRWVPAVLRDALYDGVAKVRHRVFRRPEEACPILPEHLRERFEL